MIDFLNLGSDEKSTLAGMLDGQQTANS